MAKPPVSRMQLDAYRFGQRRLDSALALRDPVLLHERIRTQGRVVAVGLVLATLIGAALVGYVKVTHTAAWQAQTIIVSNQTSQMYAVLHEPDRLVPVRNLAAARLVVAAAASSNRQSVGPAGPADPVALEPTHLDESALVGANRTPVSTVTGAPDTTLPGSDTALVPAAPWALCSTGDGATTLIADPAPTRPLGPTEGVVVVSGALHYLITGGRKYPIGPAGVAAYDLTDAMAGAPVVAAAQLALIPYARLGNGTIVALTALSLQVSGGSPDAAAPPVAVVRAQRPGQPERFYLVAHGGVTPVSAPVATMIRAGLAEDLTRPASLWGVDQINALPTTATEWLRQYPGAVSPVSSAGVLCWRWDASGANPELTLAPALPVPADQPPVVLAQADGPDAHLDQVSFPGGVVIAVSAVAGTEDPAAPQAGGYWLVSATGVAYPIATAETVRALGIRSTVPVSLDALTVLPRGDQLAVSG